MANIIEIEKERIPYIFEIKLKNKTYEMEINYNIESDTFTTTLSYQGEVLIFNYPILLQVPLFNEFTHLQLPEVDIIPIDISENEKRVGYDQLGETVFLYTFDK